MNMKPTKTPTATATEIARDESLFLSLVRSTQEGLSGTLGHLAHITPEQHADERSGIDWRTTDELLTLISYLLALIGACADAQSFDALMGANTLLYEAVRRQRRAFHVQSAQ